MTLRIEDQSTVVLEGYLDANGDLQFRHGQDDLSSHGNSFEVAHDGEVRVYLRIPSSIPARVEHEGDDGLVTWADAGEEHDHRFPTSMTDAAEVNVFEKSGSTRHKTLHFKVTPTGALPER